ncbi:MAG: GNAT family N-acetyltransferase [Mycobacteriales bacterium]
MTEVAIRPMTQADVEAAVRVQMDAFADLDRRFGEEPTTFTDTVLARSTARHRHFVDNDADGSWVATLDDRVVGVALALRRDDLWGLSLLNVDPTAQSAGIGRRLLDAALTYAEGCARAVILSSPDARAIRAYGTSGLDLYPQVKASGVPELGLRPPQDRAVRDGTAEDRDFADEVDRVVRKAGRGADHAAITAVGATMFVVDDRDGRGYAYVRDGDVYLLAATNDATATTLLWHCFERSRAVDGKVDVSHITGEQQWAVEACLAARLAIAPDGPVFWRGATPPRSYLPSGAFL